MEKGKSRETNPIAPFSAENSCSPLDKTPHQRTRQRAGSVLSSLGAAGLALGVASGAKADDEFIKVAPDGNGGPAIAEIMDETGASLGTFNLDVGPDSQPNDIITLPTEGITLVAVATEASPSGNENGDIFSLNSSGANALGFGLNAYYPAYSLSLDESAGSWSMLSRENGGSTTLKICSISNLTNCEDFPLPVLYVGSTQTDLDAPEPYVVAFCSNEWGVISLGQDTDFDGFPDGPVVVQASGLMSGSAYDSHINRFGANGESIAFGLIGNNLVTIEADGSSLTALQGAAFTDMGSVGFFPTHLNASDGYLFIAGEGLWPDDANLARFVMGETPSTTVQDGSTLSTGIYFNYPIGIGFDSSGSGWMGSFEGWAGTSTAAEFNTTGGFSFTGASISMGAPYGTPVFTILQTTLEDPDNDGDGWTVGDGDCDDADPDNFPGNPEACDGADNDCDGVPGADEADADFDGFMECAGDCDDTIPTVNPGQIEIMGNGLDDDCNPATPDTPEDPDDDGDGWTVGDGDCDDADSATHPGATETCDDTTDSDCDGSDNTGATIGLEETYPDEDEDGEAADGASATPYCPSEVPANTQPIPGADCDDTDPSTYTGAPELMNGEDNDCDGIPAAALNTNIENRDETLLGSTTDAASAGPNVLEAGGVNIRPVSTERTIDEFGNPVDLLAYNRQILAMNGVFSVDRRSGGPEIVVYEMPEGAPPDYVDPTGAGVTGSRLEVQANADGTKRYTCTNTEGSHYVEVTTNFYSQEIWDAYLAANPGADETLVLNAGETVLFDTMTGEILETNAADIGPFKIFADAYIPGDDDDATPDDDDTGDDDTGDDDTGDDDTGDDDTETDDDDTTEGDDDGADDDDDSTETPPDCNEGCNEGGGRGGNPFASLLLMLGAVGGAVGRRFRRPNDGPSNLTGPAMIDLYRGRVDALTLAAASTPVQTMECSRQRIRRLAHPGQHAPAQRKAARRAARHTP